jgi:hypothetical protein
MKKMKKFEGGGLAEGMRKGLDTKKLPDDVYATIESDPHSSNRKNRLSQIEEANRKEGRRIGNERQEDAQLKSAPAAYLGRGVDFVKDKMSDADAYLSGKMGLDRRAAAKRGMRQGLKDEGYKAGGMVSSASKRADGCATKGKTRGKMVTMKSGGMC